MNKVMEVGRYIGAYEANEKTALVKHHGRDWGKKVGKSVHGGHWMLC